MSAEIDDWSCYSWLSVRDQAALRSSGIDGAAALLEHFPRRHEDRRRFDLFPQQPSNGPVCLRGRVMDTSMRRFGGGRSFYEAVIMDGSGGVFGSGTITCRWFNMSFIHKLVAAGQDLVIHGKVKELKGRLIIDQPEFEVLAGCEDEGSASIHLERIVPIYRNLAGLSQRRLREIIHRLLQDLDGSRLEPLPDEGAGTRADALRQVHFPESLEQAAKARRAFALEEFFRIQLNVQWRRARHMEQQGRVLGRRTELLTRFYHSLPFDLTEAQKRSVREIIGDMRLSRPMNRLLQGDVGSGKTFVAMAAMLLAVDSGCQAALMAPTQILAEQHFLTFRRWLEPLGLRMVLRTGAKEESSHEPTGGPPQIIIGTHALLYDEGFFSDLGLVIIDEQHKFGVAQRAALIRCAVTPDVLVMTATPIPRTLTMTLYGDLDVSLLDEKPAGRGKVVTGVRIKPKQADINRFLIDQLEQGRQAYLVYPLVEESESLKVESATEAHEKWCKRLKGYGVGLIHGKLKPDEKESVMKRFREGEIRVLVSTTVIEVGVDVPNATVMILHHAERFGLAQLHQLRGRIGRGEHKGYCVLLTDGANPESLEKLRVLEASADGFEIAEADLRLRGPGNVMGTEQSGVSDIRFVDFLTDTALLREANRMACDVLAQDPMLDGSHRQLRCWIRDGSQPLPRGA